METIAESEAKDDAELNDHKAGTSMWRSMPPSKVRPLSLSLAAGMRLLKATTSMPGLKPTVLRCGGPALRLGMLPTLPAEPNTDEISPLPPSEAAPDQPPASGADDVKGQRSKKEQERDHPRCPLSRP